ncbi:hypothetical protein VUR80DRAFT_1864 [Thermomyces stellatus]
MSYHNTLDQRLFTPRNYEPQGCTAGLPKGLRYYRPNRKTGDTHFRLLPDMPVELHEAAEVCRPVLFGNAVLRTQNSQPPSDPISTASNLFLLFCWNGIHRRVSPCRSRRGLQGTDTNEHVSHAGVVESAFTSRRVCIDEFPSLRDDAAQLPQRPGRSVSLLFFYLPHWAHWTGIWVRSRRTNGARHDTRFSCIDSSVHLLCSITRCPILPAGKGDL